MTVRPFFGIIKLMNKTQKIENYQMMLAQAQALFANEKNLLPNSVFTGFYLFDGQ